MDKAEEGDTVKVQYIGKLEDGTVFDQTRDGEPIQFTIGENKLLKEFEGAMPGMTVGQKKTIHLSVEDAYGPYREEMVVKVGYDQLPDGMKPSVGQRLRGRLHDGRTFVVTIIDVGKDKVTLDANHPLAGENLTFEIELLGIIKKK